MKTIVTGGAGFIGSHLVEALVEAGHQVLVIDNFASGRRKNIDSVAVKVDILEADVAVPGEWMKRFNGVDWVFHLAALADIVPSIQRPRDYFTANVDGTFNVLEAVRAGSVRRMVYTASSSCYGVPVHYPTPETEPVSPRYPYALTKWMGEQMAMHWAEVYKLPVVSLRLFNVYGPRARTSGTYGAVFGVFLAQKLAGKPYTVVGDGEQTRDFTFVTDVARAFIAAAQSDVVGEIFNVGSGKTVSVNTIVKLLGGEKVHIPKRPGEPDSTFANIESIRSALKWEPKVPVEQGVARMLERIDDWKAAPVWEPESIARETQDWFNYLSEEK